MPFCQSPKESPGHIGGGRYSFLKRATRRTYTSGPKYCGTIRPPIFKLEVSFMEGHHAAPPFLAKLSFEFRGKKRALFRSAEASDFRVHQGSLRLRPRITGLCHCFICVFSTHF
jgi:hypothetical protein